MSELLVVKDDALINARYELDLTEQRLILFAISYVRKLGVSNSDLVIRIHASDYMKNFNVEKHAAYEALKNASSSLFERQFIYLKTDISTGEGELIRSKWVERVSYIEELAMLEVIFTSDVFSLITRLEDNFTSYQLKQVNKFTSKYGVRLYELLISWRDFGKTPVFEILELRYKLGVKENEYKTMANFKSRVLEPAIRQINEFTDINASYKQYKQGCKISGFEFTFKNKLKRGGKSTLQGKDTSNVLTKLSDRHIEYYASELSKQHSLYDLAGNMNSEEFEMWIVSVLKNKESIRYETAMRMYKSLRDLTDYKSSISELKL